MSGVPGNDPKKRAETKAAFLEAYKNRLRVDLSCKDAKVTKTSIYKWRKEDPEFAAAFAEVRTLVAEALEDEAFRRAYEGNAKPVYQNGKQVGHVQEYSDLLCIFLLKAIRPEVYRDRYDVRTDSTFRHEGEVKIYIPDNGRGKLTEG